jgi:hypothetical protein
MNRIFSGLMDADAGTHLSFLHLHLTNSPPAR